MENLAILGGTPVRSSKYIAYHRFGEAEKQALSKVIDDVILSSFYGSKRVREFEQVFANYHGAKYGVAVNSGTAALHTAYIALGLQPGDEVIVPANAYISAATAALQVNAIPVFADIDPDTFVLDPKRLEEKITSRTKMIVPVHLYGQPVDMPALMEIARRHGLLVVEDAAQAHGARIEGRLVGTFGDAGCFSLCCRKHVIAGEGGIVITNNKDVADTVRELANKGKGIEWWDYRRMGYSYLMTEMQAVIALSSLARLEDDIVQRRRWVEIYQERLGHTDLILAKETPGFFHVYFKFPFLLPPHLKEYTAWFEKAVQAENVIVERSYPVLYHIPWIRNKEGIAKGYPYQFFRHGREIDYSESNCHVAEDVCSRLLAACTGPDITEKDVDDTINAILKVYDYLLRHKAGGTSQ